MAKIPYRKSPGVVASAMLIAVFAAAGGLCSAATKTAQTTITLVEQFEGYVPEAYLDPVGILAKCYGDTTNVKPGAKYSFEECARSLNSCLAETTKPIFRCVPDLYSAPSKVQAAFASMAYNIGPGAFCQSSVAKLAKNGEWEKACVRISQIYKTAKGKPLPGLETRRNTESALCLEGLAEAKAEAKEPK